MAGLRVVFLGTGTSHGVPMIGCDCCVCTSSDPRDRRMRTSILVQWEGRSFLVDTAPEFRLQCVGHGVRRIDAVLYTHGHADHVVGLDDLRRFNELQGTDIPLYGSPETLAIVRRIFPYAFDDDPTYVSSKPALTLHPIDGPFDLFGMRVVPVPLLHGPLPIYGYRFGRFAYCTDCSVIPDGSWELLEGLDVLVLDALRRRPHPTHMNLEQAVAAARRIGARRTLFTHIAHELMHTAVNAALPSDMALAHDGLAVDVPG